MRISRTTMCSVLGGTLSRKYTLSATGRPERRHVAWGGDASANMARGSMAAYVSVGASVRCLQMHAASVPHSKEG